MNFTLIAIDTTEQVGDDVERLGGCVLRREAYNVDAVQDWEDVGWDDLVDEHSCECCPEELDTLVVGCGIEVGRCKWMTSGKAYRSVVDQAYLGRWKRLEGSISRVSTITSGVPSCLQLTAQ